MNMAVHYVFPNSPCQHAYPRRPDRQYERPTAKNAQGLFLPDACIFVGNLSTKVSPEKLAEDVKVKFSTFGRCHVKVKLDKKNLPGAFVQYEQIEDAETAMRWDNCIILHKRWLRIEKAKGKRTACLGFRSFAPISPTDVAIALFGQGPLEVYTLEPVLINIYGWTTIICKATFAYIDDYKDALKFFKTHPVFYLNPMNIEGNPMLPQLPPPAINYNPVRNQTQDDHKKAARELMRDKGPSRVPLPLEYQPTMGLSIEEYVREEAKRLKFDLGEKALVEVIRDVENRRKEKCLMEEWRDSGTGNTNSNSVSTPESSTESSSNSLSEESPDLESNTSKSDSDSKPN